MLQRGDPPGRSVPSPGFFFDFFGDVVTNHPQTGYIWDTIRICIYIYIHAYVTSSYSIYIYIFLGGFKQPFDGHMNGYICIPGDVHLVRYQAKKCTAEDHWGFPGDFTSYEFLSDCLPYVWTNGWWDFHPNHHCKIANHQLMKACCYFHKNEDDVTFFHCVFSMHCLVPGRILLFFLTKIISQF